MDVIVEAFKAQALQDAAICEAMRGAAELLNADEGIVLYNTHNDEQLAAKGWTRAALRVAIHACMPKSGSPTYLHFAQERHVNRMKTLPTGGDGGKATTVVIPVEENRPHAEIDAAEPKDDQE